MFFFFMKTCELCNKNSYQKRVHDNDTILVLDLNKLGHNYESANQILIENN